MNLTLLPFLKVFALLTYVLLDFTESCNVVSESSNVNPNGSKTLVLNQVNSGDSGDPEKPPGESSWWDKGTYNRSVPIPKSFRINMANSFRKYLSKINHDLHLNLNYYFFCLKNIFPSFSL